jgi:small GTP-binding protein
MRSFRVVAVGDCAVGKTSIINRITAHTFNEHELPTESVGYINVPFMVDGSPAQLQLWDTAGQERYRSLTSIYYRGSVAALVVFSWDDEKSFEGLANWINEFEQVVGSEVLIFVIGNKADLLDTCDTPVDQVLVEEWAEAHNYIFCSVSALNDHNIAHLKTTIENAIANWALTRLSPMEVAIPQAIKPDYCC